MVRDFEQRDQHLEHMSHEGGLLKHQHPPNFQCMQVVLLIAAVTLMSTCPLPGGVMGRLPI